MTSDIISLIANIALALSFIVGLIFGISQVLAAARDRRERFSLEALRSFQTREFAELMQYIIWHDIPKNREEILALPVADQVIFIHFSQVMESLGILVAERYIGIDIVDKTLGSFITTSWDKYKTVVQNIRETPPNPDPFMSEYFQWLAEQIDKRMKEKPRKPFYETHRHI
jgi:hypothetical protein